MGVSDHKIITLSSDHRVYVYNYAYCHKTRQYTTLAENHGLYIVRFFLFLRYVYVEGAIIQS